MRRTRSVVGAVILAIVAMVGIGFAAFNAGVDEGISRELAQSESGAQVVRVVGHGYGMGLRPRVRLPVRADPVPAVLHRDRAAGPRARSSRALGRSPLVGSWWLGPKRSRRTGRVRPSRPVAAARPRSTSTTGGCTSSPGRRPVPVTSPAGAPPGRPRPTRGPSTRDELDRRPNRAPGRGGGLPRPAVSSGFGRAGRPTVKRILVVEDESKIARLVRDYLEHAGFEVVVAIRRGRGPGRGRRFRSHLVVLDLGLPGRDGWTRPAACAASPTSRS